MEASIQTFKEEVIPYIDKYNNESKVEVPGRGRPKRGIKMILIAAVITILLGSILVTNALGYNIWEMVVNWGKETFHIGTGGEVTDGVDSPATTEDEGVVFKGENTSYQSAEEAAKAFSDYVLIPKWIPAGFEFTQASISEAPGQRSLILVYLSDGEY